jgi:hypothetical protein
MRKTLLFPVLVTLLLTACSTKKSRVVVFEYGEHYDTSCAILEGQVYEVNLIPNSKDSLYPVVNAMVKSTDSADKVYKTAYTNSQGKFSMSFFNEGTYNLVITKEGFQTIRITNFIADTGQTSTIKIILEKDHKLF